MLASHYIAMSLVSIISLLDQLLSSRSLSATYWSIKFLQGLCHGTQTDVELKTKSSDKKESVLCIFCLSENAPSTNRQPKC